MQAAWDTYKIKRSVLDGTGAVVAVLEGLKSDGKVIAFQYVTSVPARGPRKTRAAAQASLVGVRAG